MKILISERPMSVGMHWSVLIQGLKGRIGPQGAESCTKFFLH